MGYLAKVVAGALALTAACSSKAGPEEPSFHDVDSAPPTIRQAAEAVVLVTMPGFSATASFISPDGLLLTNNHVLGVGACPLEGCYAQLTWDFQRGDPPQMPTTVFVVPKAVDVGLDLAILQASDVQGGGNLPTPSYLTIDARTPAELLGTHVTVVGHPMGTVKKWTDGRVVDSDGNWITTSAFILPGSSGSPLLDDHGHFVGLIHRSPTGEDLVTSDGLDVSSVGTPSAAVIAAMSEPLPASMVSDDAVTTAADAVTNQQIYLDARRPTVTFGTTGEQVLDALGDACDAALAVPDYPSPEAANAAMAPCFQAEVWIECRSDVPNAYAVCPGDTSAWTRRYQAVFEYWRRLNGNLELDEMSFAEEALAGSMAEGQAAGAAALMQALAEARPPLDFHVAAHLAAFGIATYAGQSVVDFARGYANVPGYGIDGEDLVSTVLWLGNGGALPPADTVALLASIHGDDQIDLGTKLFIETAQYYRGILP